MTIKERFRSFPIAAELKRVTLEKTSKSLTVSAMLQERIVEPLNTWIGALSPAQVIAAGAISGMVARTKGRLAWGALVGSGVVADVLAGYAKVLDKPALSNIGMFVAGCLLSGGVVEFIKRLDDRALKNLTALAGAVSLRDDSAWQGDVVYALGKRREQYYETCRASYSNGLFTFEIAGRSVINVDIENTQNPIVIFWKAKNVRKTMKIGSVYFPAPLTRHDVDVIQFAKQQLIPTR
ncbi:MAG: hypothetical protein WCP97_10135 [bacterium]